MVLRDRNNLPIGEADGGQSADREFPRRGGPARLLTKPTSTPAARTSASARWCQERASSRSRVCELTAVACVPGGT